MNAPRARWTTAGPAAAGLLLLCAAAARANPEMTVDLAGGVAATFVWIEPGAFWMGSPAGDELAAFDERPRHRVRLTQGFWLGQCELTQEQWEAATGARPWETRPYVRPHPRHPAVCISWDDLQELLDRLTAADGQAVYRLPSEAEWEYACRAGTATRWSFGDDDAELDACAWHAANAWEAGRQYGPPVGTRRANPWGLHDMHGGVWEWVQDGYGDYRPEAQVDPRGPPSGSARVVRSGNFGGPAAYTRSANRYTFPPGTRSPFVGARLARTGPVPTAVLPQAWGAFKRRLRPPFPPFPPPDPRATPD